CNKGNTGSSGAGMGGGSTSSSTSTSTSTSSSSSTSSSTSTSSSSSTSSSTSRSRSVVPGTYPWPPSTRGPPPGPPPTPAATWYVDGKAGDDAHDGKSEATAFATIKKAVSIIAPGDTVLIVAGLYREGIDLTNAPVGTATKPITFGSYGDGEVILDG